MIQKNVLVLSVILFAGAIYCQNSSQMTTALADSLFFKNQFVKAIPIYQKSIADGLQNAIIYNRLGYSLLQGSTKSSEAIKHFYSALSFNPNPNIQRVILIGLAKAYCTQNKIDSAVHYLNVAIPMGYLNLQDLESSVEFKNLRSNHLFEQIKQKIYLAAFPCMSQAEARWFDFWVGEWDAFVTGTTNKAGESKIEKISGECAILENWSNANNPFSGKSINFFNSNTKKWEQHWVGSQGGYQKFENGEYTDGAMRFTFNRMNADSTISIGKLTFFNHFSHEVRQLSESSNDDGQTWSIDYDFTYLRKKHPIQRKSNQ